MTGSIVHKGCLDLMLFKLIHLCLLLLPHQLVFSHFLFFRAGIFYPFLFPLFIKQRSAYSRDINEVGWEESLPTYAVFFYIVTNDHYVINQRF